MNPNLIYIGTYHGDPKGEQRLAKALKYFKPDVVLIEGTGEPSDLPKSFVNGSSRNLISECKQYGLNRSSIAASAKLLRSMMRAGGHEYRAAKRYADENPQTILHSLEESKLTGVLSDQEIGAYFREPLIHHKSKESYQVEIDQVYSITRKAFNAKVFPDPSEDEAVSRGIAGNRDQKMSKRLRDILERYPNKRVVVVCGQNHFSHSDRGNTLYSKTTDLEPNVIFLSEADNLV